MATVLHYLWWFYLISATITAVTVALRFDTLKEQIVDKRRRDHKGETVASIAVTIVLLGCIIIPVVNTLVTYVFWMNFFISFRKP